MHGKLQGLGLHCSYSGLTKSNRWNGLGDKHTIGAITSLAFKIEWRYSQRRRFGEMAKVLAKDLASKADEVLIPVIGELGWLLMNAAQGLPC